MAEEDRVSGWSGWVVFAAFVMGLSGIFHIILGIAGILSRDWYLYDSGDIFLFNATAWGWSMLIGGALLILSAALLLEGNMFGRIIGGILVVGSLLANIALISVAPLWSITVIVIDILILYAIIVHAGELKRLNR